MEKEILNEYVKLIDKGYCEECNELNCIDNFPHKKIASAISDLQLENTKLKGKLKKQKEVIDKAVSILKDNFVYDYVRSCDTTDGVGYDEIDTEHFTYRVYKILNEVSE